MFTYYLLFKECCHTKEAISKINEDFQVKLQDALFKTVIEINEGVGVQNINFNIRI